MGDSSENISIEQIPDEEQAAPSDELPHDHKDPLTGLPTNYDQKLGFVGKMIGGSDEKPGNIAVVAIIGALVLLFVMAIGFFFTSEDKASAFLSVGSGLLSVITAALGYMFGRGSSNKPD